MASTELRVKELLKERGWTTKILAEKTGMSESYLTHIKNGTRRWNEDALRKMAHAFGLDPVRLFVGWRAGEAPQIDEPARPIEDEDSSVELRVRKVPVVGDIPSYPSPYNNEVMQVTTGYKEVFVPVLNEGAESLFALAVENNLMSPVFVKGDRLVVAPGDCIESGGVAAVEFQTDKMHRAVMMVSYVDDFVVLESVNHRQPPIALMRGRDHFRVIGRVIYRYQRF